MVNYLFTSSYSFYGLFSTTPFAYSAVFSSWVSDLKRREFDEEIYMDLEGGWESFSFFNFLAIFSAYCFFFFFFENTCTGFLALYRWLFAEVGDNDDSEPMLK